MHIQISILADGRLARVVYIFSDGTTPTTMLVPLQDLDEALEGLRRSHTTSGTIEG